MTLRSRHRALLAATCLLLAAAAGSVLHTALESSDPAKDSVRTEAPDEIRLRFTTAVQIALSTAGVTSETVAGKSAVPAGDLAYADEDQKDVLVLPLTPRLGDGLYTVTWRTAGPDGHAISGDFSFRVQAPEPAPAESGTPPASAAPDSGERQPAQTEAAAAQEGSAEVGATGWAAVLVRFLFYAGLIGLLGAAVFRFFVLERLAGGATPAPALHLADARTTRLALISVLALLASAPLRLADQAQAFFPGDVIGNMGTIAMETTWGRAWWLQVSAAALGLIAFAGMRGPQRQAIRWRIIGLAALATATVPPLSGHAWGTEPRLLAVASDYFHVLAAGGWMGGLACLLLAALPGAGPREEGIPDRPSPVPAMVKLFSRMALLAVSVLVLTGGLNVWLHLDAVSELWTTMWGRSLLGKLVFVLAVMGLGLYNWRIGQPAVAESGHSGPIAKSALFELFLGTAAVVATSFLVGQP